jgi:hypothetical protein
MFARIALSVDRLRHFDGYGNTEGKDEIMEQRERGHPPFRRAESAEAANATSHSPTLISAAAHVLERIIGRVIILTSRKT